MSNDIPFLRLLSAIGELKEHAKGAKREILEFADRDPAKARVLFKVADTLLKQFAKTSVYGKLKYALDMWSYGDEERYYDVDAFGMSNATVELMMPFFQFLYHHYFRVDVEGAKNIARNGPALVIANHSGTLPYDGAITNLAVYNNHPKHRYARYLVDDFVYYVPFAGTFIQRTGGVRACQENAVRLLDHGHMVMVFPEGLKGVSKPFEERYQLQRFGRGGYVKLAMRTGVPVIPTAIIGAEEIHPMLWKSEVLGKAMGMPYFPFTVTFPWLGPLGLIPLPTKWKIIFGKPISFKKFTARDAKSERKVKEMSQKIQAKVQSMIDTELEKRESVWY